MNRNTQQATVRIIRNHVLKKLGRLLSFTTELSVLPVYVYVQCNVYVMIMYMYMQCICNNKSQNKRIQYPVPNIYS